MVATRTLRRPRTTISSTPGSEYTVFCLNATRLTMRPSVVPVAEGSPSGHGQGFASGGSNSPSLTGRCTDNVLASSSARQRNEYVPSCRPNRSELPLTTSLQLLVWITYRLECNDKCVPSGPRPAAQRSGTRPAQGTSGSLTRTHPVSTTSSLQARLVSATSMCPAVVQTVPR
jgi:hypothetical protein